MSRTRSLIIVAVAVLAVALVSCGLVPLATVPPGWEGGAQVYGLQANGTLKIGGGPHDFDDAGTGLPDVEATSQALAHTTKDGVLSDRSLAAETREVSIGGKQYVYALHYYTLSVKVRTRASSAYETNLAFPGFPMLGQSIRPQAWITVGFRPWDAINGAEERWVGIMNVMVLDVRSGHEGDVTPNQGIVADPGSNPGSQLTMYDTVGGATVGGQDWQGAAPDGDIVSSVAVKVEPTLLAGYYAPLLSTDAKAVDAYVVYDLLVEVLVLGEVPQTGGQTDWTDDSGTTITGPSNLFEWFASLFSAEGLVTLGVWLIVAVVVILLGSVALVLVLKRR